MRVAGALLALGLAGAVEAQTIVSATYTDPTTRYAHGILGDAIEHAGLEITLSDGRRHKALWSEKIVFEDTQPRLVDLDGDGAPEVIVVESHEDFGARLSVWGWNGTAFASRAHTDFIGRSFRWLAVAGAADMDGDGFVEIAYVDRPHLAKTLMVWRYVQIDDQTASLRLVAQKDGLTNHRIGETDIGGGMRICGEAVEVITASADWTRIMATRLEGDRLIARDVGPHQGRASLNAALGC